MEIKTLLSACGALCFLGTVVGAIVAVVILARRKYGDQEGDGDRGERSSV